MLQKYRKLLLKTVSIFGQANKFLRYLHKIRTMKNLQKDQKDNAPLQEGKDYYIENGFYVFTAAYHQKRGYCCKSGCRHCPYGFKKIAK
jgi:hypothetical protein